MKPGSPIVSDLTRQRVALILEGEDYKLGRAVSFTIMGLIAVSVVTVTLASLSGLPEWLYTGFRWIEIVMLCCFTIEYLLRIWSAERPLRYIFSFWGVIDLFAILPMLLFVHSDTLMVRVLRLLRLFRLLKLGLHPCSGTASDGVRECSGRADTVYGNYRDGAFRMCSGYPFF